MNYQNGKIYRLIAEDNYFYLGSTIKDLKERFWNHKADSKRRPNNKKASHFCKIGWDKVKIELVENFPCNSRKELLDREQEHIEQNKVNPLCLNTYNTFLTKEEKNKRDLERYYEKKDEILKAQKKKYEEDGALIVECEFCKTKITKKGLKKHQLTEFCKKNRI